MRRSMITSMDTVTQVSIKFGEKKKAHKNMGIRRGNNKTQTIHEKFPPKNGVTPKLPSEVAQCL